MWPSCAQPRMTIARSSSRSTWERDTAARRAATISCARSRSTTPTSFSICSRWGASKGPPSPPTLGSAAAKPRRSLVQDGGPRRAPKPPRRSVAPRQSRGAPRRLLKMGGVSAYVGAEEFEGALAGGAGARLVVAAALVATEAVAGGVNVDGDVGMGGGDLL